ncbi:MAG TPA: hypothetical protein VMW41_06235 [Candidatus Bathyarchaeia archaeon]|nr:hypothetical protein [Candidatus Bathyarchaeia archaeon]
MIKPKFTNKIFKILRLLPEGITFTDNGEKSANVALSNGRVLLKISASDIQIPGISIANGFYQKPSPLADNFVSQSQIERLFEILTLNNLFQRLNHLGFCYPVESVKAERERLIKEAKSANWHLYQESSNDNSAWLFIGERNLWPDPLVELIFNENIQDKWKNYWLPHFQIDIDTYLNGDEIEKLVTDTFQGKVKPYRIIANDKFIVLVRARLGIVSGINVNLDLGFEGRMTRYSRLKLLSQLV